MNKVIKVKINSKNRVEIIGGDGLENAFKFFKINSATKDYSNDKFEIWSMLPEDYEILNRLTDDDWNDDFGWWRFANGSNQSCNTVADFICNDKPMKAYINDYSYEDFCKEDYERPENADSIPNFDEDNDKFEQYMQYRKKQEKLTTYICNELGASMESNVFAIAQDLADINDVTVAELFEIYEG